jgi:3-phosphoshikimate 1-carboxyvinyltransferase
MNYVISAPGKPVQDTIYIPSSKSISNRMLVLEALAGGGTGVGNLSESDDTRLIRTALESTRPVKDIGHAGTAMRFLTAYYATRKGRVTLTGSRRMKERPVGPLVDALRELGGTILYLEREGCPPLDITGGACRGGRIRVDGSISSQFISALMMIGPVLEGGLHLTLEGEVVSGTYLQMTASLMRGGGADISIDGNEIAIRQGGYRFGPVDVESDWSGASYWYQVAALMPGALIRLPYLHQESLQGDSVLTEIFSRLGVESRFAESGVTLHSGTAVLPGRFAYDFTGCPDLVQTCAATLCGLGIPFRFGGTRTLRVKETDRVAALQAELGKFGFRIDAGNDGEWIGWDGTRETGMDSPVVRTYHDHRMAMAFAPLCIPFGPVSIEDPLVVTKSYPGYWSDLGRAGFKIAQN